MVVTWPANEAPGFPVRLPGGTLKRISVEEQRINKAFAVYMGREDSMGLAKRGLFPLKPPLWIHWRHLFLSGEDIAMWQMHCRHVSMALAGGKLTFFEP